MTNWMAQKWHEKGTPVAMTGSSQNAIIVPSQSGTGHKTTAFEALCIEGGFFMPNSCERRLIGMRKQLGKPNWLVTAYWSMVGMASAMMMSLQPVMADTIWERFSTIMKDIYGQVVGISTIVAVTVAAIALIIRMISRNQRAVDEATSWLKHIVVTWIVLNSLGFIVAYLQPLIAGGQYSG